MDWRQYEVAFAQSEKQHYTWLKQRWVQLRTRYNDTSVKDKARLEKQLAWLQREMKICERNVQIYGKD